ncbi:retrovirus-related pol polyprotein from transposon TNT 1-94 [Tanacetum coccineum]
MLAIDGTGFDWIYMPQEEASTNFALMAFSDSEVQNNKTCSKTCLKNYEDLKTQYDKLRVELRKSESDLSNYKIGDASYKDSDINGLEKQVERLKKGKEKNQFKIDNYENASKSLFAPPSVDLSSSRIEKFKEPEFEGYGVKVTKSASENVSKEVKKTSDAPIIEDWVSDFDEDETVVSESLNVQKPKQADQPRKVSQNPRNNSTSWNTPKPKKLGVGFQFTPKACFVCGSFNHLIKDCDFHDKKMVQKPVLNNVKKVTGQREVRPVWTNAMRVNHQNFSNSKRNFAPKAVLTKSGYQLQGINAVKPTAYWAWRPKVKMINHVYKNTGFCVCKQFDYVDPTGRNKVLNSPYFMVKSWLVQDQTVLGQTATGKESSNPFMAGSLPKTISPMIHISQEVILLKEERTVSKDSEVCKITRADGTSSFHGDFQALLRRLDRQDLFQLYSLVQERYKHRSIEGHDLDLWGDLKMMFDPNEEDDIWLNQHYWELLRWKLHEYSGVHSLFLDGTSIQINMLVDKKYPLKKEILKKMINLKIEAEEESDMASELIKFIKSQIAEQNLKVNHKFRGGLLGIKELLQDMLLKNLVPLVKELSTEAIERLQQGESLNIQDAKTNLFWEFEKFTSHDEESIESYYFRFYKLMNEIIRNNLTVDKMQVNVQFLQQLQPESSRFVTIVKQQHKLDEVSYHKFFDILKQCQKEVNELRAERIAKNANLLALVATAQPYQDPYYQTSKSHKSSAPTSKASLPTRSHATTRHKGKEIAKPITPPSESASKEDSDPEQAQKDKEMQKNLALIAKYFKKLYKPTNNNLRTSLNTRNKNVDTTPRYKNDNQSGQFGNQMTMTVAGARETVGGQVVQQSGIQCFNCKEFGHFAKECRKPKRVKDSTYHKEKMLLCKQAEKGVQLQAEQSDWLVDTDEEIDEQELEAHYSYMAKIQKVHNADSGTNFEPLKQVKYDTRYNVFANEIQHSEQSESISNTCVVETVDGNVIPDSPNMCDNDIQNDQNAVECDDERVALANLMANLKLDIDENKRIQKQLKKANASLTQELKECKSILAETSRTLGESNSIQDSCLVALQNKQTEFERYKAFNDRTVNYDKLERKLNETLGLLAQKDIGIKEGLVKEKTNVITDLKLKEEKDIDRMISMENQLKPAFANPMYLKKAQYEKPCLYEIPHDQFDLANRLVPDREEILTLERESQENLNKDLVKPYE